MLTFIRYIEVYCTFAFMDCVRYYEDFVKSRFVLSRFCSIHFIVILGGLKKIVRYTEDLVTLELKQLTDEMTRFICSQCFENYFFCS